MSVLAPLYLQSAAGCLVTMPPNELHDLRH